MKFQADTVEHWSRDAVETVLFGNAGQGLALLMSNVPGTSDHYLEWNDQANACTNGVMHVQLSRTELFVQLSPKAAEQIGETAFTVELLCGDSTYEEAAALLARIFGKKLTVRDGGKRPKAAPKQDYRTAKYLNLEGKNLTQLPDYVQEMTLLETAKLAHNPKLDFHAVCEVLSKMPGLKELTFTSEQQVPDNIGRLSHLESLSLIGFTTPQRLPESFGLLKKLKDLLFMTDSEVILPESFAELSELEQLNMRAQGWQLPSKFYELTKLTTLDFSNCRLRQVPEEMAGMRNVTNVFFSSPEVRDYPQILRVLAKMPNLKVLELCVNPVPKEVGLCGQIEELTIMTPFNAPAPLQLPDELFELKQLKALNLSGSQFDEFPPIGSLKGLESLVIQEADFERLPDSIGQLSNLVFLNLSENPSLRSLPESLGNLTQLKRLYLADLPLLTRLPEGLKNLTNLEEVLLSNRESVANIPEGWNNIIK